MKLTITITGRNDNHANYFADRMCASVLQNINLLSKYLNPEIRYEYLIVDWCSKGAQLHEHDKIKRLLKEKSVRFLIVPPEIIEEKYGCERFYQFFAKNVSIRHANGEWVLMINADNILNRALITSINKVLTENSSDKFFRTNYWIDITADGQMLKIINCLVGDASEAGLAPTYSGDFLLCKKQVLINKAKGHDESNLLHQSEKPQAHMDGEILFNLKKNGVLPVVLDNFISHITHPRSKEYDYEYNKKGYDNTPDWGFLGFKEVPVVKQVSKLQKTAIDTDGSPENIYKKLIDIFDKNSKATVFDIGACDAKDSIRYYNWFPSATVYSFEPVANNYNLCLDNISRYAFGSRIICKNLAMSDKDGIAEMFISAGNPPGTTANTFDYGNKSSSLLPPHKHLDIHSWCKFDNKQQVETVRIDTFCNENNISEIDFVHLDVQGAELQVLSGAGEMLKKIKAIFLEVEAIELYKNQPLKKDIERFMLSNGFIKVVDTVDKVSGDQLWIKN